LPGQGPDRSGSMSRACRPVTKRQSAMISLRASATIMALRVPFARDGLHPAATGAKAKFSTMTVPGRFARDSPLEESGFEPLVPPHV
jgi:hypothetical protein